MAVVIAQQNGAESSTVNPSLSFPHNVTAGNFLYAIISQASSQLPGAPTCSLGQQFQIVDGVSHPSGLSVVQYRFPNTAAGRCSISFSTVAASSFAIVEFSGVQADAGVGTETGVIQPNSTSCGWSTGSDHRTTVNPFSAQDLVVAFLYAPLLVPLAFVPGGWATVADFSDANISFSSRSLQVSAQGPVTAEWTTPGLSISCISSISLQPA